MGNEEGGKVLSGKNRIPEIDGLRSKGYRNQADIAGLIGRRIGSTDSGKIRVALETLSPVEGRDFTNAAWGKKNIAMFKPHFQIRIMEAIRDAIATSKKQMPGRVRAFDSVIADMKAALPPEESSAENQ